jgi:hypothetical protein
MSETAAVSMRDLFFSLAVALFVMLQCYTCRQRDGVDFQFHICSRLESGTLL